MTNQEIRTSRNWLNMRTKNRAYYQSTAWKEKSNVFEFSQSLVS